VNDVEVAVEVPSTKSALKVEEALVGVKVKVRLPPAVVVAEVGEIEPGPVDEAVIVKSAGGVVAAGKMVTELVVAFARPYTSVTVRVTG